MIYSVNAGDQAAEWRRSSLYSFNILNIVFVMTTIPKVHSDEVEGKKKTISRRMCLLQHVGGS